MKQFEKIALELLRIGAYMVVGAAVVIVLFGCWLFA
jgi:hypothetical protein